MKKNITVILFLFISGFLLYSGSLPIGPREDDKGYIVRNESLKDVRNIPKLFTKDYFNISYEKSYRLPSIIIYMINYRLFGDSWSGWHASNILFHVVNSILVFFFMKLLLSNRIISIISAAVFLFHPVLSEAVIVPSSNEDIILATMLLLSMIYYIRYRIYDNGMPLGYLLSLVFCFIAVFTKEPALIFPAIIIIYDFGVLSKQKKISIKTITGYIPFVLVCATYFFIHYVLLGHYRSGSQTLYIGDSIFINLMTMSKVFFTYIRLMLFPVNLNLGYYFSHVTSFFVFGMILRSLMIILMIALLYYSFKKNRKIFFLYCWILVFLMPSMNLLPVLQFNLLAERYLYVPVIGFCGILGYAFHRIILSKTKKAGYLLVAGLLCCYTIVIELRIRDWSSERKLYEKAVKNAPENIYHRWNLAMVYLGEKDYDLAIQELAEIESKRKTSGDYRYPDTAVKMAGCYYMTGRLDRALEKLLIAYREYPKDFRVNYNLGILYEDIGKFDEACNFYRNGYSLRNTDINVKDGFLRCYMKMSEKERELIEVPGELNKYITAAE